MRRLLLISLLSLAGCGYMTPYKLDIPQGNAVTADQAERLKIGMTRAQARFVMGTPLLTDVFHQNRWDYVFYDSKDGVRSEVKRFHILFENDRLVSMGGDTLPARVDNKVAPAPAAPSGEKPAADVPATPAK